MEPLNLGRLQQWIDAGRINTSRVITMKDLHDSGLVTKIRFGVKLLADVSTILFVPFQGKENFHSKIRIDVSKASQEAIATVEKNGGQVREMNQV